MANKVTGIILAGGKSKRMGIDKGLMPYRGKAMIEYSIDALLPFCNSILISTSKVEYSRFGFNLVDDEIPESGPIGGLYSCLKRSNTPLNVCLPCDVPNISREVVEFLIKQADVNKCVVPVTNGAEPLIAVYPLHVLDTLKELIDSGMLRMTEIFNRFPTAFIPLNEFPAGVEPSNFSNINRPDDSDEIILQ